MVCENEIEVSPLTVGCCATVTQPSKLQQGVLASAIRLWYPSSEALTSSLSRNGAMCCFVFLLMLTKPLDTLFDLDSTSVSTNLWTRFKASQVLHSHECASLGDLIYSGQLPGSHYLILTSSIWLPLGANLGASHPDTDHEHTKSGQTHLPLRSSGGRRLDGIMLLILPTFRIYCLVVKFTYISLT